MAGKTADGEIAEMTTNQEPTCFLCDRTGYRYVRRANFLHDLLVNNYPAAKQVWIRDRGRDRLVGIKFADKFVCISCSHLLTALEDYFEVFNRTLVEASFSKQLIQTLIAHPELIPPKMKIGQYLTPGVCNKLLRLAGIDETKARSEIKTLWERQTFGPLLNPIQDETKSNA